MLIRSLNKQYIYKLILMDYANMRKMINDNGLDQINIAKGQYRPAQHIYVALVCDNLC